MGSIEYVTKDYILSKDLNWAMKNLKLTSYGAIDYLKS